MYSRLSWQKWFKFLLYYYGFFYDFMILFYYEICDLFQKFFQIFHKTPKKFFNLVIVPAFFKIYPYRNYFMLIHELFTWLCKKVVLSGETQKLNMYQAINHGLNIALENDPRSGKDFVTYIPLIETCTYQINRSNIY